MGPISPFPPGDALRGSLRADSGRPRQKLPRGRPCALRMETHRARVVRMCTRTKKKKKENRVYSVEREKRENSSEGDVNVEIRSSTDLRARGQYSSFEPTRDRADIQ